MNVGCDACNHTGYRGRTAIHELLDMTDDIKEMIAELKHLNPKPGNAFGSEPVQPVVPDIFIRAAQDGSWLVELLRGPRNIACAGPVCDGSGSSVGQVSTSSQPTWSAIVALDSHQQTGEALDSPRPYRASVSRSATARHLTQGKSRMR